MRNLSAQVKSRQIVVSILKRQVNSSSNFALFFIVIVHNSSVIFKLIYFLLWIKRSHQSPNVETFECSSKNLANSSCHFPNHQSVFLQFLHQSSVSWKISPLCYFSSKYQILCTKGTSQSGYFEKFDCSSLRSKFTNFWSFLKLLIGFSSNFASFISVMRY